MATVSMTSSSDAMPDVDSHILSLTLREPHLKQCEPEVSRSKTAHRQHQCKQQHAPFTGTPVATQEIKR